MKYFRIDLTSPPPDIMNTSCDGLDNYMHMTFKVSDSLFVVETEGTPTGMTGCTGTVSEITKTEADGLKNG